MELMGCCKLHKKCIFYINALSLMTNDNDYANDDYDENYPNCKPELNNKILKS